MKATEEAQQGSTFSNDVSKGIFSQDEHMSIILDSNPRHCVD